jgi:hypothetical protein
MKFYGHANLQQNELQNAVLTVLTAFPTDPKVGQIAFVNSIVYVCIQNTAPNPPIWVPLTQEITAYTHTQSTASSTWSITHNLNTTSINVQVFDGNNRVIIPDEIEVTGPTTCAITLAGAITGRATIVTGHFDGVQKPTYAYTYYQTEASTTWTIVHNLGYDPIVRVFIGTSEVQPATVSFPDTNTVVITFDTAEVGTVRLI